MLKLTKRILAAAVVLAAGAPSVAYARFNLDPPAAAPAVNSRTVQNATPPSAGKASTSSSQGFQWDDAGIGAVGVIVLVSAGSGAMLARRRRTHYPLTS